MRGVPRPLSAREAGGAGFQENGKVPEEREKELKQEYGTIFSICSHDLLFISEREITVGIGNNV